MFIVHIDGDELWRQVLKRAIRLSKHELDLKQFASGDEAMPYIERCLHDVDLFYMSVELPGHLTGLQVARSLRAHGYSRTIVLTSACDAPDAGWLTAHQIEFLP